MSHMITLSPGILIALTEILSMGDHDGLSDEQRTQLQRVGAALETARKYTSLVEHIVETSVTETRMKLFGLNAELTENAEVKKTVYSLRGETPNRRATFAADVLGTDPRSEQKYAYTLTAEARWVDGVLYVNAKRTHHRGPDQGAIPDGWIRMDNPADWPGLDKFSLSAFAAGQTTVPDTLSGLTPEITFSTDKLDDGTPVEIITFTLQNEPLKAALQGLLVANPTQDDSISHALVSQLDPGSAVTITIALNTQDQIVLRDARGSFNWTALDMHVINPGIPPGTIFDSHGDFTAVVRTDSINAALDPAEAPPIAAP